MDPGAGTGPIVLQEKLGEGGFGVMTQIWNVSTTDEYAPKQPSVEVAREKRVRVELWEEEARIMRRVSRARPRHVS